MRVKIEDLDIVFEVDDIEVLKLLVYDAHYLTQTSPLEYKSKFGEELVYVDHYHALLYKGRFLITLFSLNYEEVISIKDTMYRVYKLPPGTPYKILNNMKSFEGL